MDEKRHAIFLEASGGELQQSTSMLNADPPDHTRLRRLVSKAFTPSSIEALRPRVQELVDGILDSMEERGGGDVVAELAFPLPFDVISEMLGMPEADKDLIAGWSGGDRQDARPDHHSQEEIAGGGRRRPQHECPRRRCRRLEAGEPGRRPADGADRRRGGRRPAVVAGAARSGEPAVRGGPRDHGQPHRHRASTRCCGTPTSSRCCATIRRST